MNTALIGFFILLLFQLIGTLINHFLFPALPASVIGMILLFISLQIKLISEEYLDSTVSFFMKHLPILFLPPAVGIITVFPLINSYIVEILFTIILSTMFVLISVGGIQQFLTRKNK